MTNVEYEDLPYEELRKKAFDLAEQRRDFRFFYDLLRHSPTASAAAGEGGSLGDISGSIIDMVRVAEENFDEKSVGDLEPLFIANYATYLRAHTA